MKLTQWQQNKYNRMLKYNISLDMIDYIGMLPSPDFYILLDSYMDMLDKRTKTEGKP